MIKNILLCLLILLMFTASCSPSQPLHNTADFSSPYASTESSTASPSGQYTLTLIAQTKEDMPENGVRKYIMSIHDLDTDSVTLVETEYRVRDNVLFIWDDNRDRIWVNSSDTGIYFWDYDEDLFRWVEFSYTGQEDASMPNTLTEN